MPGIGPDKPSSPRPARRGPSESGSARTNRLREKGLNPQVEHSGDGKKQSAKKQKADTAPAEKPVSLHPLKFEEAVRDLLKVKPKGVNKGAGETQKS